MLVRYPCSILLNIVLRCIAVCTLAASSLIAGENKYEPQNSKSDSHPPFVFSYRNHNFRFRDITGVSYQEALMYSRKAYTFYKGGILHPISYIEYVDETNFPRKPKEALTEFCNRQMNSIARIYIASFVFDRIKEKYPDVSTSFFKEKEIDIYCRNYAKLRDRWNTLLLKAKMENWPAEKYAKYRGIECTKFTRLEFENKKYNLPMFYLLVKAFPPLINGHPSPWVKPWAKSHLVFYQAAAILRKDKNYWYPRWEEYEKEKRFQDSHSWDVLVVDNVRPKQDKLDAIEELLDKVVDEKGRVAILGLDRANRTFRSLGSDLSLGCFFDMSYRSCKDAFGLDISKVEFRRLVQLEISKGIGLECLDLKPGCSIYIYVLCRHNIKPYSTDSGGKDLRYFGLPFWYFYYGRTKVVRPFVVEVLNNMRFYPPYVKPSLDDLVKEIGREQLLRGCCGDPILPRVADNPVKWKEQK